MNKSITPGLIKDLKILSIKIRKAVVYQLTTFGFGHLGGSMSSAELMACLYGYIMKYDPDNPKWEERDRLILSKGHCGPVLYAVLALKGFFPYEELATLNQPETRLPSHVDASTTPGVDMTTGSLGQGFSVALGMAHIFKIDQRTNRVFGILGDGECQEGQIWEAALYGAQYKLSNFTGFVDANAEQFDRYIKDNIDLGDLAKKFHVFGSEPLFQKATKALRPYCLYAGIECHLSQQPAPAKLSGQCCFPAAGQSELNLPFVYGNASFASEVFPHQIDRA
jgi:transketolase